MIRRITALIFTVFVLTSTFDCKAIDISASSAVVLDTVFGEVLFERNAHQKMSMASTTKIMTAICALEHGNINDAVKVHPSAVGVEGSSMYLAHGEELTLGDLLYGLMLASGNDAAVAIAMHISGSVEEFAKLMNETALKIGVTNTSFKNPNGLDADGHYTTAYDLAMITRYGMSIPEFARIVSTDSIKIPWKDRDYPRVLKNHNKLLRMYDGANGVKTGFTKKSGRCLVSSAERGGVKIIAVTLNAPDDWNDHMRMLDYGFENYETKELLKSDEYLKSINIINGTLESIAIHSADGFSVPVKKGGTADVKMVYDIPDDLDAPIGFDAVVGKVEFYYKDKLIGSVDAVSRDSVAYVEPKTFGLYIKKIFTTWILMGRITC